MSDATLAVVAGTTATAAIDGISAAGADPELRRHTPSADLEIVADGRTAPESVVPVSPSGCPTPAVVTRAVRELVGFEFVGIDAGLAVPTHPTDATVLDADAAPGGDVRDPEPVPDAAAIFERARGLAPEAMGVRTGASDGDEPSRAAYHAAAPVPPRAAIPPYTSARRRRSATASSLASSSPVMRSTQRTPPPPLSVPTVFGGRCRDGVRAVCSRYPHSSRTEQDRPSEETDAAAAAPRAVGRGRRVAGSNRRVRSPTG